MQWDIILQQKINGENEALIQAMAYRDFENTMLRKAIHKRPHVNKKFRVDKSIQTEGSLVIAQGLGVGENGK